MDVRQPQKRRLLRVNEFAAEVNVTEAAVRRWLLLRRITAVKIGRAVRIPATEVERLVAEGLRPARARDG